MADRFVAAQTLQLGCRRGGEQAGANDLGGAGKRPSLAPRGVEARARRAKRIGQSPSSRTRHRSSIAGRRMAIRMKHCAACYGARALLLQFATAASKQAAAAKLPDAKPSGRSAASRPHRDVRDASPDWQARHQPSAPTSNLARSVQTTSQPCGWRKAPRLWRLLLTIWSIRFRRLHICVLGKIPGTDLIKYLYYWPNG